MRPFREGYARFMGAGRQGGSGRGHGSHMGQQAAVILGDCGMWA